MLVEFYIASITDNTITSYPKMYTNLSNHIYILLLFYSAMKTFFFSHIQKACVDLMECIEVKSDNPSDPSRLAVRMKNRLNVIYPFTFADFAYHECCLPQNWMSKRLL